MEEKLFTAGEFAKLARTTKRTVLWYAEKGIVNPYKTDESGYRMYRPEQIIDFQGILLMRKLGFSIADIQAYIGQGQSLQHLFEEKRSLIEKQIANLERTLADTKSYYTNLTSTGTLVNPVIKQQKSFEIYYLDKQGPYASIKGYLKELRSMFNDLPDNAVFLTIYMDAGYNPKNAKMRIGIMRHHDIQLKTGVTLPLVTIPEYRALIHKSHGPGALLSMLWQELNKYRINQRLSLNDHLPFTCLEFYKSSAGSYENEDAICIAELHLPIEINE